MKKIMLGLCFLIYTISFANDATEEYEVEIREIEIDGEELRPIIINIIVSNIQDASSSNKTTVSQNQEILQEVKDIQQKNNHSLSLMQTALLVYLLNKEDENEVWGGPEW